MENGFIITGINRIIMVGKDEYLEEKTSFSHNLHCNELIFHFSGYSTVFFGDTVLETSPNTIRFLPQGDGKRYDVLRHQAGDCIDICFSADRPISPQAFVQNVAHNEKIGGLFKKIFATWVSKKDGYYFESLSLLYRIFSELQKENHTPKQHSQKIAPAIEIIQNDFLKTEISISALAACCGMGESYFLRLFKEKYGMSPKKYIIQLKINHACDLLQMERYTVTQIAELCNFSDVYFFSRQFKDYIGITPTQYIKKYKSSK